jgi:hypothetical protein
MRHFRKNRRQGPYRDRLGRAFIGEDVIRIPIDVRTGGPAGPDHLVFKESGRLARAWTSDASQNPTRRFTRVGAILCLEEFEQRGVVNPDTLVVHNPYAAHPLPRKPFLGIPEFFCDPAGHWRWSDEKAS